MSGERIVYKICGHDEWATAVSAGRYDGSADDRRDGFIHFSTAAQLTGTLARHFRDRGDLVLIAFESASLGPALTWEPSRGGALFPHLYGPLDPSLAQPPVPLSLGADGTPHLPASFTTNTGN